MPREKSIRSYTRQILFLAAFVAILTPLSGASRRLPTSPGQDPTHPTEGRTARIFQSARIASDAGTPDPVSIKAIRNLEKRDWLQDLEIEVRNNSSKPIYFLEILLLIPELPARLVEGQMRKELISLTYGKPTLMLRGNLAASGDASIGAGQAFVLKLSDSQLKGFEYALTQVGRTSASIRNVDLRIYSISFGDGTGYKVGSILFDYSKMAIETRSVDARPAVYTRDDRVVKNAALTSRNPVASLNALKSGLPLQAESCGPPGSGCQRYTMLFEFCPNNEEYCSTRTQFSGSSSSNPESMCLGWIDYNASTCSLPGPIVVTCIHDVGYSCEDWESSGHCTNIGEYNVCISKGPGWYWAHCECMECVLQACPSGCSWSCAENRCVGSGCESPILVDVLGNGFNLTDARGGVDFDLDSRGTKQRLSWTALNSDDAFLALDRNGNGTIDNGAELFGNYTPQPVTGAPKNGFIALAEYDKRDNGGNGDGKISRRDSILASLLLWQDVNHNGISERNEIHGLRELGLAAIDLDYQESGRVDENGNRFQYKARVRDARGAQLGRWAWDVFFTHE